MIVDGEKGLPSRQEQDIACPRYLSYSFRGETKIIVAVAGTKMQFYPVSDEGFEFFRGEGGERRRGRLENRVFMMQLFELIYPHLAVLRDLIEAFACLLRFKGKIVRVPGVTSNEKGLTIPRRMKPTTSSLRKTTSKMSKGSDEKGMVDGMGRSEIPAESRLRRALELSNKAVGFTIVTTRNMALPPSSGEPVGRRRVIRRRLPGQSRTECQVTGHCGSDGFLHFGRSAELLQGSRQTTALLHKM